MVPASRGLTALLGLLLLLGLFITCEEEAIVVPTAVPTATPAPAIAPTATTAPTKAATAAPVATAAATPVATPAPTATPPPAMTGLTGTLNVGMPELGPGVFDLPNQGYEQFKFDALTTHEAMFATSPDGAVLARIVQDWSADPTGLVYTFPSARQRPMPHCTAIGVYSTPTTSSSPWNGFLSTAPHSAGGHIRRIFTCDACALGRQPTVRRAPDPRLRLASRFDASSFPRWGKTLQQSVGTGPWELMEVKSGDSRTMRAVDP